MKTEIFVFGSNLKGIHGSGAAKYAREKYGAELGKGWGLFGNSYALPTKRTPYEALTLEEIKKYVDIFKEFAVQNLYYEFKVTRIGCGLAGFKDEQIAPMFNAPSHNCRFDAAWLPYLIEKDYFAIKFFDVKTGMNFSARVED